MTDYQEGQAPEYEDVDLNGPYTPRLKDRLGSLPRQSSTFQDVITSGISAFTGRPREQIVGKGNADNIGKRSLEQHRLLCAVILSENRADSSSARGRKQSLGLLSDDGGFDEDAFRLAQEEDAKRRVERVKEIKRGLDSWKGWRVDSKEMRLQGVGGGRDCGPVFEV